MKRTLDYEELVEEKFEDYFNDMETEKQITLWNEYARDEDEPEIIYNMSEFEEVHKDWELLDLIAHLDSSFDTNDTYFWTDRYGDICSSYDATDAMDMDGLKDWFTEHYNDDFDFRLYCGAEYDEDGELYIEDEDEE